MPPVRVVAPDIQARMSACIGWPAEGDCSYWRGPMHGCTDRTHGTDGMHHCPCGAKIAWRETLKELRASARAAMRPACGSTAAYHRHLHNEEKPCDGCKQAYAADQVIKREERRR